MGLNPLRKHWGRKAEVRGKDLGNEKLHGSTDSNGGCTFQEL